jgi:hypothetical protein
MIYFLLFSKSVTSCVLDISVCNVWLMWLAAAEKRLKPYAVLKTCNPIWRHNPQYIGHKLYHTSVDLVLIIIGLTVWGTLNSRRVMKQWWIQMDRLSRHMNVTDLYSGCFMFESRPGYLLFLGFSWFFSALCECLNRVFNLAFEVLSNTFTIQPLDAILCELFYWKPYSMSKCAVKLVCNRVITRSDGFCFTPVLTHSSET